MSTPADHPPADALPRKEGGSTTVDAASTSAARVTDLDALVADYQELNMSNYTDDDVGHMNGWGIDAYQAITSLRAELADAKAMANHYEDAFNRRGAQNKQQASNIKELEYWIEHARGEAETRIQLRMRLQDDRIKELERMCEEFAECLRKEQVGVAMREWLADIGIENALDRWKEMQP